MQYSNIIVMNKRSKQIKYRCYLRNASPLERLPIRLKMCMMTFLVDINLDKIPLIWNLPQLLNPEIMIICYMIPELQSRYNALLELLKLRHYLLKYAKKYIDVYMLYHIDAPSMIDLPTYPGSTHIKYYVTDRIDGQLCDNVLYHNGIAQPGIPIEFVDRENLGKTSFIETETVMISISGERNDQLKINLRYSWCSLFAGDKLLITRSYFPFLYEHEVSIKLIHYNMALSISANLTIEKFKELVNTKERKRVFKDSPLRLRSN